MDKKIQQIKNDFDKEFPEAKILREQEIRKRSHDVFFDSNIGKMTSYIYLAITPISIFIYWKFFNIKFVFSIFLGITTWIIIVYFLSKILIKILGIKKTLIKINDEEIKKSVQELEEKGISMNNLFFGNFL